MLAASATVAFGGRPAAAAFTVAAGLIAGVHQGLDFIAMRAADNLPLRAEWILSAVQFGVFADLLALTTLPAKLSHHPPLAASRRARSMAVSSDAGIADLSASVPDRIG